MSAGARRRGSLPAEIVGFVRGRRATDEGHAAAPTQQRGRRVTEASIRAAPAARKTLGQVVAALAADEAVSNADVDGVAQRDLVEELCQKVEADYAGLEPYARRRRTLGFMKPVSRVATSETRRRDASAKARRRLAGTPGARRTSRSAS